MSHAGFGLTLTGMSSLRFPDLQKPGPSLREVLGELVRFLVENVENLADDPVRRIHDIRVSTKKIRSLLRLARAEIPKPTRKALTVCLREIKNAFSVTRDADVLRERIEQVFSPKHASSAMDTLGLSNSDTSVMPDTGQALSRLAELSSLLAGLSWDSLTRDHLVENVAASYRQARKLMRRCQAAPNDEVMHAWRKRVKDVCYHAMALAEVPVQADRIKALDALAEQLGEYHDLALLHARVRDRKPLAARVRKAKKSSGRKCFRPAEKLFAQPAGKFAKELDRALRGP